MEDWHSAEQSRFLRLESERKKTEKTTALTSTLLAHAPHALARPNFPSPFPFNVCHAGYS